MINYLYCNCEDILTTCSITENLSLSRISSNGGGLDVNIEKRRAFH
jgi:hypothetical protein